MDFRKASDNEPHGRLVQRDEIHGMQGQLTKIGLALGGEGRVGRMIFSNTQRIMRQLLVTQSLYMSAPTPSMRPSYVAIILTWTYISMYQLERVIEDLDLKLKAHGQPGRSYSCPPECLCHRCSCTSKHWSINYVSAKSYLQIYPSCAQSRTSCIIWEICIGLVTHLRTAVEISHPQSWRIV